MILYKAIKIGDKPHSLDGFFFLATTPKNAFMWAETIYFGNTRYFIDEYKIPDSELCLYNTDTYTMRDARWEKGTYPTTPIRVGDLPTDLPDTAQVAVITDNPEKYEYTQIAYWDGTKLITKRKNEQARLEVSKTLGYIVAVADRLNLIFMFMKDNISSNVVITPLLFDDNGNEIVDRNIAIELQMQIESIDDAIQESLKLDGLTTDYVTFLQAVLDDNQIVATYAQDLKEIFQQMEVYKTDHDYAYFDTNEEAQAFAKQKYAEGYSCEFFRHTDEKVEIGVHYYRPIPKGLDDKWKATFDNHQKAISNHYKQLINAISKADFLIPSAKTGYGLQSDVYWF
jgi:hypothetical protein